MPPKPGRVFRVRGSSTHGAVGAELSDMVNDPTVLAVLVET